MLKQSFPLQGFESPIDNGAHPCGQQPTNGVTEKAFRIYDPAADKSGCARKAWYTDTDRMIRSKGAMP